MNRFSREVVSIGTLALASWICLLVSCTDGPRSATEPVSPQPVRIETADSSLRVGPVGWLSDTLRVVLTDAEGRPAEGRDVAWTVSESDGEVRALITRTGADGQARAVWWLAATTEEQRLTVSSGGVEFTFRGRVPARAEFTPSALSLWVADTARPAVKIRDANGHELRHQVVWRRSAAAHVLEVDELGLITARQAGEGSVAIDGVPGTLRVSVGEAGTGMTITGRVAVVGPAAPPPRMTVDYQDGRGAGHALTDADGTFTVRVKHTLAEHDTAEFVFKPADVTGAYHPSIVVIPTQTAASGVTVIAVPTSWRIRRGMYRGEVVPISVNAAMSPVAAGELSYWYARDMKQSAPAAAWGADHFQRRVLWPDSVLPIAVAMIGGAAVGPQDSATLWLRLDRLEEIVGIDLFRPIEAHPEWTRDARLPNTILVAPVSGFVPNAIGRPDSVLWNVMHALPRGFPGRPAYVSGAPAVNGSVELFYSNLNAFVVQHEFLHTLGLGHGCGWHSVMASCIPGELWPRTPELSPADVAYLELLYEIDRSEHRLGTRLSIYPALFGERVITLGRSPLP